jgi:CHAT domain-containing protein
LQSGDATAALHSIERALHLVERERSALTSRDLAGSYITEHRAWYELAVAASMRQAAQQPGQHDEEAAFAWAERARARSLLDSLGQRAWGPAIDLPPALRRQAALNRYSIEEQQDALEKPHADTRDIAGKLRHLYEEQDALEAEQRAYTRQQGRATERAAALTAGDIVSVEEVQQTLLDPQAAMIAFSVGQQQSYRWLITRHGINTMTLPGRDVLEYRFATLLAALAARRPAVRPGEDAVHYAERQQRFQQTRERQLQDAGTLLLRNLPPAIHRLYIVADGPLLSLPWSALRVPCHRGRCYAMERYTIESEPSASVALSLARQAPAAFGQGIAVISDASSPAADHALLQLDQSSLDGSRREGYEIAELAHRNAVAVTRQVNASPAMIRTLDSKDFGVLHIAAHTVLIAGHPELSGIALAPGPADTDGVLWIRDISRLRAPPLVVLSGCRTQGGAYLAGESLRSLTQAFFFAGADQVVGSLWSVEDDATARFMQRFYSGLLTRRLPAVEALRAAQISAWKAGSDLSVWGAFLVNGVSVPRSPNTVAESEPQ